MFHRAVISRIIRQQTRSLAIRHRISPEGVCYRRARLVREETAPFRGSSSVLCWSRLYRYVYQPVGPIPLEAVSFNVFITGSGMMWNVSKSYENAETIAPGSMRHHCVIVTHHLKHSCNKWGVGWGGEGGGRGGVALSGTIMDTDSSGKYSFVKGLFSSIWLSFEENKKYHFQRLCMC